MKSLIRLLTFVFMFVLAINTYGFGPYSIINKKGSIPLSKEKKKAKEIFPYKQILSFYPVKTIANYMMISYERQVSKKNVFKTAIGYSYFQESDNSLNFDYDLKNYSAVRFDLAYKYFVGKESVIYNGFYISPFLSIKNANFEYYDYMNFTKNYGFIKGSANCVTTGFILGLNMPIGDSFNADSFVGNALITSRGDYKQASRTSDTYRNSISFITGLSVGFGF